MINKEEHLNRGEENILYYLSVADAYRPPLEIKMATGSKASPGEVYLRLTHLIQKGLVQKKGNRFKITEKGKEISDLINHGEILDVIMG